MKYIILLIGTILLTNLMGCGSMLDAINWNKETVSIRVPVEETATPKIEWQSAINLADKVALKACNSKLSYKKEYLDLGEILVIYYWPITEAGSLSVYNVIQVQIDLKKTKIIRIITHE